MGAAWLARAVCRGPTLADPTASPAPARGRSIYLRPWRVDLALRSAVPRLLPASELARVVARALEAASAPRPASIGLILADDRELAALNARHMGVAGPTDVLAFPLLGAETFPAHPGGVASAGPGTRRPSSVAFPLPPRVRVHLGDVVVSVERAIEQASSGHGGWTGDVRWAPADELRLLVTHGVLHVCGWDHADPMEETAMRRLETELLGRGGIGGHSVTGAAVTSAGGASDARVTPGPRSHRRPG
jgi:probable rRNA maturation factor